MTFSCSLLTRNSTKVDRAGFQTKKDGATQDNDPVTLPVRLARIVSLVAILVRHELKTDLLPVGTHVKRVKKTTAGNLSGESAVGRTEVPI